LSGDSEFILAQEQSVTARAGQKIKEVQGTLVLTNRRLLFVAATQEEVDVVPGIYRTPKVVLHFRYTDIEDLIGIPEDPSNLSILLSSILEVKGHEAIVRDPRLEITWNENSNERKAEFVQELTGGRKKNLNDWAKIILGLKSGSIKPRYIVQYPSLDTLEGKILRILGDMQEKGLYEIENRVEEEFKLDLDPDDVEASCNNLVKQGLVDFIDDNGNDSFFRKRSPLGEDDLSS